MKSVELMILNTLATVSDISKAIVYHFFQSVSEGKLSQYIKYTEEKKKKRRKEGITANRNHRFPS